MTTTTTNYGWVKPDVGASDDVWGGYINTDLDGIDAIVKGVSVVANAAYPASNPSGYQTAAQVASVVIGDNRIINGDMRIDQRNNGANGTASGYTVDRWMCQQNLPVGIAWGRNAAGVPGPPDFSYNLGSQGGATPHAMAAEEYYQFVQPIEADAISDLQFGTSGAKTVTLSFWAWANGVSGAFGGAIRNGSGTRSYPFTYTMAANTWTRIVVAIPGDTGGTWPTSGNGIGLIVGISLGQGSTYSGPANVWSSGNYQAPNGAVNCLSVAAGGLWVTGVKLEVGSVATPFNRQSLAKSMADCQRYYQSAAVLLFNSAWSTTAIMYPLKVTMRATPTMVTSNIVAGSGGTYSSIDANTLIQNAANTIQTTATVAASAEL